VPWEPVPSTASRVTGPKQASPPPEAAILHPGVERKFYLRADVGGVSHEQAEGMTDFDAVTVRGLRKRYGSGVVVDRLDFDFSRGEMVGVADAAGAGKTITVEFIQGLRRPGEGALCALGYAPVTGAAQVRPLIGGQLRDSPLPDRLRVAGAVDMFATARARDGTELLEQSGLGERGRWGFSPFSGLERHRQFLICTLPGRPERTS
jgi:ABC-2 type transport system ATP-binding protein